MMIYSHQFKRLISLPEFNGWDKSDRSRLAFTGAGGVASMNRDDVVLIDGLLLTSPRGIALLVSPSSPSPTEDFRCHLLTHVSGRSCRRWPIRVTSSG